MTETEDKSLPEGERGRGNIMDSLDSVPEVRTKTRISGGLGRILEGWELDDGESCTVALAQEHGLYVIGLCRLREWAEQLPQLMDDASSHFGSGNFSEVDQVLDQICGEVLDPKAFRAKLVRIALDVSHGT